MDVVVALAAVAVGHSTDQAINNEPVGVTPGLHTRTDTHSHTHSSALTETHTITHTPTHACVYGRD